MSTMVDAKGASITSTNRGWHLGLHLARVGRVGTMRDVSEPDGAGARDERVEIVRGAGLTEWFATEPRGIEQGVDVETKPAGVGSLILEMGVEGLTPALSDDGARIALKTSSGETVLQYGELAVKDADGKSVPATLGSSDGRITVSIEDDGARYPLVVDPLVWGEVTVLRASDSFTNDVFGISVGLFGDLAVVGASGHKSGTGQAYVFARASGVWTQQAILTASDAASGNTFGYSVSISSAHEALVGSPGKNAAYLYAQSGTTWAQILTMTASGGSASDEYGHAVALDTHNAIIGAPGRDGLAGAAYANIRTTFGAKAWGSTGFALMPTDGIPAVEQFGCSVAVSEGLTTTTALVGARFASGGGAAYAFTRNGGLVNTWSQQAKLAVAGASSFGSAVALDGDTAVVSDGNKVYVFARAGTTWSLQATLAPADGSSFGSSVAVRGDTAVVGADYSTASAAFVFTRSGTTWTQQAKFVGGVSGITSAHLGSSASVDGTTVMFGARGEAPAGGGTYTGAVHVYGLGVANGATCAVDSDCLSAHCADKVCCDTSCTSTCQACVLSATGAPDGTCANVVSGKDPRGNCPGSSCTGATLLNNVCDGTGKCRTNSTDCTPAKCVTSGSASTCAGACKTDADCSGTGFCVGSTCVAKKPRGTACGALTECTSGFCADGVCCDSKCELQCQACAEPGNAGTCIAVKGNPRKPRVDCAGAATVCGGQCDGASVAACIYPKETTTCGDGLRCSAGACVPTGSSVCTDDRSASLPTSGPSVPCAPFLCDKGTGRCFIVCGSDADCAADSQCSSSRTCEPRAGGDTGSGGSCNISNGTGPAPAAGLALGLVSLVGLLRRRTRRVR